jgi:hypothetical protein
MSNSRYGQVQQANTMAQQEYQASLADYEAKIKAGADPKALGLPPQAPAKQTYGVGDSLADTASFLAYESQFGKFDPQKWTGLAEKMDKVEKEGYESALRAAESGAPLDKIAKEFNKSGEVKFDPKDVVSDRVGKTNLRGQQIDTRLITLKDGRTINVAAELAAIGGTKEILATHFQMKEDKRGDQRLGIAGAQLAMDREKFNAGAAGRGNAESAAKLQAVLSGTQDPAERAAITQQINDLTGAGGTDTNAPSEVKLAQAAIRAGLHTDMKSALEWATKSKDLSPDKMRFEIYKTALTQSMGDAKKAKEITDEAMGQFGGGAKPAGRPVGAEQVIQTGPNKGKTAVWDGNGWKLKG